MAFLKPKHLSLTGLAFVLTISGLHGYRFRSSHIESIHSCGLKEYSRQYVSNSEVDCAVECMAKQDSDGCAAYQWEAETGICRTQKELNVTASVGGNVSVMKDAMTACLNDTDCPVNEECVNQDCPGLNVCVGITCPVMQDEGVVVCSDDADCPQSFTCVDQGNQELIYVCVPRDCSTIINNYPSCQSGTYDILAGTQQIQVWCDMDTDGGGWTVFLKRLDGSVDFSLNRVPYQQGFGNVSGEYWLGLDALHFLTSSKTYQLRADISDWEGASVYSLYSSVVVADETDNYMLTLGSFLGGEGGDALVVNNGSLFSTKDADMDSHSWFHCSQAHQGGFWYNRCLIGNPTGKYYIGGPYTAPLNDGMQWRTWEAHNDKYYSMKTLDLKIRP